MISIIIPMHNAGARIKNCLDYIARLKHDNYEVIIVDDASTDDSCVIAKESGFNPIQNHQCEGPAMARNLGVKEAKGEILFFVDSDVYLKPDTLNRLEFLLKTYPEIAGAAFIYSLEHPNKNLVSLYKNFSVRMEEMARPDFTSGFRFSAFAIKRKALNIIGGFDNVPCCEEFEFTLKMIEHGLVFYIDKEMNIIHAKRYNFRELMTTDFFRAYNFFRIFFRNRARIKKYYREMKKVIHMPFAQLFGIWLVGLFLILSFFYATRINLILCLLAIMIVARSEARFLKYAYRAYGIVFTAVAFVMRNLEIVIGEGAMVLAICSIFLQKKVS